MTGYHGHIRLEVGAHGLEAWESSGSWRVLRPLPTELASGTEVRVIGQSPGLKGGDRQVMNLWLKARARCRVTPVAAEHVLPGNGTRARQRVMICAGEKSRLYWTAKPLIPHAGARFHRRMSLWRPDPTAWLAVEEFILPGRIGSGEWWDNVRIDARMMVWQGYRDLVAWDRLDLADRNAFGVGAPITAYWSLLLSVPENIWNDLVQHLPVARPMTWTQVAGDVWVIRAMGSYQEVANVQNVVGGEVSARFFGDS